MKISYEIHDDTKWLPFVRDAMYPYRWDEGGDDNIKFNKWLKFLERERSGGALSGDLSDDENNPDRFKLKLKAVDYRLRGEYMQPFQAFYGPKERAPPLSKTEVAAKEKLLVNEIEATIR